MMIATNTISLRAKLGAAIVTANSPITGHYVTMSSTGIVIGVQAIHSVTNGVTPVTIVPVATVGYVNVLKNLQVLNADSTVIKVTLDQWDGTTSRNIASSSLLATQFMTVDSNDNVTLSAYVNAAILPVLEANNPVGTIREFGVSTNPASLLGFGTWAAHGAGRVTVAIDTGQTEFDTLGEVGGTKTHLLTSAESGIPSHTHPNVIYGGSTVGINAGGVTPLALSYSGTGNIPLTVAANTAANASAAHNNLQPYIVVYRWVRTA